MADSSNQRFREYGFQPATRIISRKARFVSDFQLQNECIVLKLQSTLFHFFFIISSTNSTNTLQLFSTKLPTFSCLPLFSFLILSLFFPPIPLVCIFRLFFFYFIIILLLYFFYFFYFHFFFVHVPNSQYKFYINR